MKKLRCGVVGLGMGQSHIAGYNSHKNAEVVAIADVNVELLKKTQAKRDIKNVYTSAEEMIEKEELDVVSVVTPNTFHKEITIAALKAGCHVLCEKPMAMNAKEAKEMLDVSRATTKRLMINFSYRFTEQSWALKKSVESGILGDIYFGRTIWLRRRGLPGFGGWFGTKALSGGGPLIDLGVHRLDLALWLMGYPKPKYVMGMSANPIATERAKREGKVFDVEDFAAGFIRFENGMCLEIEASWASNIKENELMRTRLLGTKGGLVQRNINEGYQYEAEFYLERDGSQYDMKLHPPVPDCPSAQYHLIDCIVNDKPHIATGEEGATVMELLDALYESAKRGVPINIE